MCVAGLIHVHYRATFNDPRRSLLAVEYYIGFTNV